MSTSQAQHQWHGEDAGSPVTDSSKQPFSKDFDDFVEKTMTGFSAPAISLAILHGSESWSKAYGYSDLATQTPTTPETLYFTASTTKSFTSAATAKLVESKDPKYVYIKWTTKLVDLVGDDFVLQDEYATNRITLVDALSHRTGMPRHDFVWVNGTNTAKQHTRALRLLPLHNELRAEFEYCNVMFSAVSHALETVTARGTGDLLSVWLWKPLRMTSTFYSISDAEYYAKAHSNAQLAHGYLYDENQDTFHAIPFSSTLPPIGAGGMISSVVDYSKWMHALMHPSDPDLGGYKDSNEPITKGIVSALTAKNMIVPEDPKFLRPYDSPWIYGLGLFTTTYRGQKLVEHNGGVAGYMTKMVWLPELEWGAVVMQNSYSFAHEIIGWRLIDDFLDSTLADKDFRQAGQIKTGRHDMTAFARRYQCEKEAELQDAAIRKRLYPDSIDSNLLAPSLPLQAYEGKYTHPAYGTQTLSRSPDPPDSTPALSKPTFPTTGIVGPLYAHLSRESSLDASVVLHHVSCEHWYAYRGLGPGSWIVDDATKARFEIGADGKVVALWWQCENALEGLAEFKMA